jgi:YD repeat-containing protein
MPYNKTIWVNGQPPALNAVNLQNIEDGIEAAMALAEGIPNPGADGEDYRYEWDVSGNLVYYGYNSAHDADQTETGWIVTKFTYDEDGNITRQEALIGSWSGRTSLGWGA